VHDDAAIDPAPDATWDAHARRRELAYQVADDGSAVFRPRVGAGGSWALSAGRGTVYATTTMRPRGEEPRAFCLINLDEGFRMAGRVVGVAPDAVVVGQRVELDWEDGEGEDAVPIPVFRPAPTEVCSPDPAERGQSHTPRTVGARPTADRALRGRVAIAGAALSDMGSVAPGTTAAGLAAQAVRRALAQAGLTLESVDGLFAASTQLPWASATIADELGIGPQLRTTDSTQIGGSSPIAHLNHARAAIAAGLCDVAVVAYGSTQRLIGRAAASIQEVDRYEAPYRPLLPIAAYALAASRHMHEFGTTPEQLAAVAVSARQWAQRWTGTPAAWATKPLTIDDVLAAPRLCDPLGVKDCCLVTDGGAAVVLVARDHARALGLDRPEVLVLGIGEVVSHRHVSAMPDLVRSAAIDSGARAYAEAGVGPQDVQVAQLYDAFTITPIVFLEDLGFCAKGDGGPFVASGAIAPGGTLPVNTTGGGLSFQHPGMNGLPLLVEGVRQVREEGRDVSLVHGNGGAWSSQCTVVLGSSATA